MDLKRGIDKATAQIVGALKNMSKEVGANSQQIEQVASISANNDAVIGKLIAEAMQKVGKEGVITVEEAKGHRNRGESGGRHAVRPRLHFSVL